MEAQRYLALWAKHSGFEKPYPLACHLLDTAVVALILWDEWLRVGLKDILTAQLGEHARRIAAFACGIHDIGKANPVFAAQLGRKDASQFDDVRAELAQAGFSVPSERSARQFGINGHQGWFNVKVLQRHERASAQILCSGPLSGNTTASSQWLAINALAHHGRFGDPGGSTDIDLFTEITAGSWRESWSYLRKMLSTALGLSLNQLPEKVSPTSIILLSGLTVLADRIASTDLSVSHGYETLKNQDGQRADLSHPENWMDVRHHHLKEVVRQTVGLYDDFKDRQTAILGNYEANELQTLAANLDDGLWLAMAPTGFGKTEAALMRHSKRPERLLFFLPTMATSNALIRRLHRHYAETTNVAALTHGLASVEDFYAQPVTVSADDGQPVGLHPTEFVRSGSARLLAPVCVGTIDQALMAALPQKWTHLRLLALANAHVVIDEAHTMEEYQTALIEPLFSWWGMTNTRVSVLTATLPTFQRDVFTNAYRNGQVGCGRSSSRTSVFPSSTLISGPDEECTPIDTAAYQIDLSFTECCDPVLAHVGWHRGYRERFPLARLGIIVNTIDRAQGIARQLVADGQSVIVLHSRMTAGHRSKVAERLEKQLGKRGTGVGITVIGTQAIEASLDIDLDAMSTDLAPAPSLIQRAGRVWRHKDDLRTSSSGRLPGIPHLPLHIVRGEGFVAALPYFESALDRTWNYLSKKSSLQMPAESQDFVDRSALTLEESLSEEFSSEDEGGFAALLSELEHYSLKVGTANRSRNSLELLANEQITKQYFDILTSNSNGRATGDDIEHATRYVERESQRVILVGDAVDAWPGSISELNTIRSMDRAKLSLALRASLSLSGRTLGAVLKRATKLEPLAGLLMGCSAVTVGDVVTYDKTFGLEVG